MSAVARMAMLDLRTVAPYRAAGLVVFGLVLLIDARSPVVLLPALVLFVTTQIAVHPFVVADKAGLATLYAVLPLSRRSVLYGHYAWAVASFVATATVGGAMALLLARVEAVPFGGRTLALVLTLAWVLFAVNVAMQIPLFVRFGYTRISVLATTMPLVLVVLAVVKLHLTVAGIQAWIPLLWVAGAAAMVASARVAVAADRRQACFSGPRRDARPGGRWLPT